MDFFVFFHPFAHLAIFEAISQSFAASDFRFPVDPASRKMSKKKSAQKWHIQFHSTFSVGAVNSWKPEFFCISPRIVTFGNI